MSDLVPHEFTPDQLNLIKSTVAKGATNDELRLFLYRAKIMGLDPLKSGQIYFVKYGSNPGTVVIGLDGFRFRASKTGKHTGTQRGIIRDDKGKCMGAWCEVYRSDWTHPAREEVSLAEYNTGKAMWAKMPETMIKKVAEVAALRMAFPDELGGIYSEDEIHETPQPVQKPIPLNERAEVPTTHVIVQNPQGEIVAEFDKEIRREPIEDVVNRVAGSIDKSPLAKWGGQPPKEAMTKLADTLEAGMYQWPYKGPSQGKELKKMPFSVISEAVRAMEKKESLTPLDKKHLAHFKKFLTLSGGEIGKPS